MFLFCPTLRQFYATANDVIAVLLEGVSVRFTSPAVVNFTLNNHVSSLFFAKSNSHTVHTLAY